MAFGRRYGGRRLGFALILAAVAAVALFGRDAVQAQAPPADFAYVVYPPGWNLISSGNQTDIGVESLQVGFSPPLYTFQAGDAAYESTSLSSVKAGYGYWAYFSRTVRIALNLSSRDSYTVTVPAGQCVMVGNPSTKGSARVRGADRVFAFSALLNDYVPETLIGIGRGAWACNGAAPSTVSVAFEGDVLSAAWPDCCAPTPSSQGGQGLLVFQNDSPAPIIVGLRQIDQNGELLEGGVPLIGAVEPCTTCPEYGSGQHTACNNAAVTRSFAVPPGLYTLHIQSEAPNMPDLVASITVDPDTRYALCYFIPANRQ
jgi:hypothetical protein